MASIRHVRHTSSCRAYCARRKNQTVPIHQALSRNQMASIRYTVRIRLNVVRSVHVAQFNGVHTTLDSGVVRTVQVAKTRWCPYDTRLCRETRWRPYDTQCTFIRHYISASCELCTSCNQTASIRQILRIRLDIMRTVHVAKTTWCPYDTCLCRETRWRPYDTQYMGRTVHIAQFTGGHATLCARSYDIRLCDVRTVPVAKPDDVQTTLGSVAKTDGVHRTLGSVAKLDSVHTIHCARLYDTTPRCRA